MTDDNLHRRRFLKATGSAAAAVAVAGCTGGDSSGNESGGSTNESETTGTGGSNESTSGEGTQDVEVDGDTLSLVNSTMTTLDPVASTDTASGTVITQVFDALMNYPNGETSVENLLASEYQNSEDFQTYTFTLKDATFHNGDSVTAQDFVYSFKRLAASPNSKRSYFILDSLGVKHETEEDSEGNEVLKPDSLGVTAEDEKTLTVELSQPFHSALEMLAYSSFAAVPQGAVGETPADEVGSDGQPTTTYNEFATSNPVGAGPYTFDTWEQGTEAEVSAYSDYHDGEPANAGVHWQIIEDTSARYNFAMNKNADIFGIPSSKYDPNKVSIENTDDKGRKFGTYGSLRNGDTANYMSTPLINTFYIGFNMQAVPKEVRQAFAYVMNQQTMVQQVFKGRGKPAYHLTPPPVFPNENYDQHAEENYPYGYNESQIDQARQVMEEAGYGPDNMYEVQWTQYDSTVWEEMAKILRDQLQAAHIKMSIEKAPFSTLVKRGTNGNLEAYTLGWIADWPAADNFMQLINPPQTDTSTSDAISYINWSSDNGSAANTAKEAFTKVQNNLAPTDSAKQTRNEAYLTMEEANWEDVGFLNVYHQTGERFWYDSVEYPPFGGMDYSRQKYDDVKVDRSD
ncbi:ABC transporter substrate-binding protein [Halobium salinum]|uniref:ABC transporter substrate-binding protein n=1 Tax=Halobium salinum TaxID=1364940 RepID=A0ABD5PCU7_9EURY|nr:ABC transporter substrate-binding protein [Halobium salinum]